MSQFQHPTEPPAAAPPPAKSGKAIAGLVLGICSLILWCLPILGLPAAIVGLVLSIKSKPDGGGMATAGVVLNIIGIVLSLGNAAFGIYLSVTGQGFMGP